MSISVPLVAFLAARAVPGIEEVHGGAYRRTVRLAHGPAVIELAARDDHEPRDRAAADDPGDRRAVADRRPRAVAGDAAVRARVVAADPRDRAAAEAAAARLLGSDPAPGDAHLAGDRFLAPLVARRPGLRMPGTVDGGELAIRAVLGQQVSLAAARTLAGRLVAAAGEPLPAPDGALTHLWPRPAAVVEFAATMAMPRSRQRALAALAAALADGLRLDPEADPAEARALLLELPGIGSWTAEYVAMRALADGDAWMPTDLGVRHGLARVGARPAAAEAWRPHRAHAVRHLWACL